MSDALLTGVVITPSEKRFPTKFWYMLAGAEFWSRRPVFLGIDSGGARARRLLEQIIRREAHAGSP